MVRALSPRPPSSSQPGPQNPADPLSSAVPQPPDPCPDCASDPDCPGCDADHPGSDCDCVLEDCTLAGLSCTGTDCADTAASIPESDPNHHPPTMTAPSAPPCQDCVVDCEDAGCDIPHADECTEECVIVPCTDPTHTDADCISGKATPNNCDKCGGCPYGLGDYPWELQQHYLPGIENYKVPNWAPPHPSKTWDPAFVQAVHRHQMQQQQSPVPSQGFFHPSSSQIHPSAPSHPFFHQNLHAAPSFASSSSQHSAHNTPIASSTPGLDTSFISPSSSFHPFFSGYHSPAITTVSSAGGKIDPFTLNGVFPLGNQNNNPPSTTPVIHACRWYNCRALFASSSELVEHVNSVHLHACRWANCRALFASSADLANHLVSAHLQPLDGSNPQNSQQNNPNLSLESDLASIAACQWGDCHEQQPASPHTTNIDCGGNHQIPSNVSSLTYHLFKHHLGLDLASPNGTTLAAPHPASGTHMHQRTSYLPRQTPITQHPHHRQQPQQQQKQRQFQYSPSQLSASGSPLPSPLMPFHTPVAQLDPSTPTPTTGDDRHFPQVASLPSTSSALALSPTHCDASVPPSPTPSSSAPSPVAQQPAGGSAEADKDKDVHPCHWDSCTAIFTSCDALTAHLSELHVGSGKSKYECLWGICPRRGDNGFASKQKLLRHLQTHTGHRPFQCKICQEFFSESATLQQHMRRHTREKPYVCDHPGCGKAFSIAGALTIHRRIHNGHKPFKCTFCEKSFSESSNLSKHLRTHTGVRPYSCQEPGCSKAFARADQLARHVKTHKKRVPVDGDGSSTARSTGGLSSVSLPGHPVPQPLIPIPALASG